MKKKYLKYLFFVFYLIYFLCCLLLFYKQSIGEYTSDLIEHIQFGLNGEGYSIVYFTYKILYFLFHGTWGIAAVLSAICLLTIFEVYIFLKNYKNDINRICMQIFAIITCFVMPIYLPVIYAHRYVDTLPPQAWHNSTYIIMRMLGVAILILYFKMEKNYLRKLEWMDSILFAIGLIVINMVKPNFILAFAPMMAIRLIQDFVLCAKGERINCLIKIIQFGALVLPSLIVLIFQNTILFGKGTGNSVAITFGKVFWGEGNPVLKLLLSMAFPIIVLLKNRTDLKKDKIFGSIWLMWLIAFGEYFFLCESGERSLHGNFTWGLMFCVFMVFAVSICKFWDNLKNTKNHNSCFPIIYVCLGIGLLILHLFAGIDYYIYLLFGGFYLV